MAHINYTGGRATKWMRYIARALVLTWAGWWVFFAVASLLSEGFSTEGVLIVTGFSLILLAGAVIPWRWEAIGGAVLVLEGILVSVGYPVMTMHSNLPLWVMVSTLLALALPPLVAGSLFLASWRKSKTSGIPQNSA